MDHNIVLVKEEQFFMKEDALLTTITVNARELLDAMLRFFVMLDTSPEMRDYICEEKERRGIVVDTDAVEAGYMLYPDDILFMFVTVVLPLSLS